MEAKCVAGKFKPPEKIGLTLPQKFFAISVSKLTNNRRKIIFLD